MCSVLFNSNLKQVTQCIFKSTNRSSLSMHSLRGFTRGFVVAFKPQQQQCVRPAGSTLTRNSQVFSVLLHGRQTCLFKRKLELINNLQMYVNIMQITYSPLVGLMNNLNRNVIMVIICEDFSKNTPHKPD